jgi:hypothetical protein
MDATCSQGGRNMLGRHKELKNGIDLATYG